MKANDDRCRNPRFVHRYSWDRIHESKMYFREHKRNNGKSINVRLRHDDRLGLFDHMNTEEDMQ